VRVWLIRGLIAFYAVVLAVQWFTAKDHQGFWPMLGLGLFLWFAAVRGTKARAGTTLGSASFGSSADLKKLAANNGDLLIGRAPNGQLLRYDGPAHLLTIAPTRSGKGVGTIIPNLLTARRSVVCIDPKGENARVCGRKRASYGPVHCLDPFGASGRPTARYNPLDRLEAASLDLAEDAMTLADALVFDQNEGEAHWNEEAKALISGIILYVVCHDAPEHRNLVSVREYLTLAPDDFKALLIVMQDSDGAGGLIARAANRFLGKSEREAAGVLSGAQRHTHFLDSPRIAQVVKASDFSFADLKDDIATVFLVLPPDRLDTYARWLRLILAQAINDMARSPARPQRPVLFLLDEFAALGRLQPIERAMGLMAGYGLQLWPILQDVHQLRSLYDKSAGTFLSNAGVLQAFGINDFDTADMLSKTIGRETIAYETSGRSQKDGFVPGGDRTLSRTEHIAARNLMDPNEIMKLSPEKLLLMRVGENPLIVRKLRFYDDKEFKGMFEAA
jgi:type IV secretion system protein VirD4